MRRLLAPTASRLGLALALVLLVACGKRVDRAGRDRPAASTVTSSETPRALTHRPVDVTTRLVRVGVPELEEILRQQGRRGTLVNVWATWCGPCREELPMLAKVARRYAAEGLAVLPLSVAEPEQEHRIGAMLEEYGFSGPFYVATRPLDELKRRLHESWPGNIPVSFLFDARAEQRFFWTAQVYERELLPRLDRFLEGRLETGRANFGIAPGKTY